MGKKKDWDGGIKGRRGLGVRGKNVNKGIMLSIYVINICCFKCCFRWGSYKDERRGLYFRGKARRDFSRLLYRVVSVMLGLSIVCLLIFEEGYMI